jgi:hypothetical protein
MGIPGKMFPYRSLKGTIMPYSAPASFQPGFSLNQYLKNQKNTSQKKDFQESTKPLLQPKKNPGDTIHLNKSRPIEPTPRPEKSYFEYERNTEKMPVIFPKQLFTDAGARLPPGHEYERDKSMWVINTKETMPPPNKKNKEKK